MMRVVQGDCVEVMARMPEASVDSIVCDPPYGLEFMGKEFDALGAGPAQQAFHALWAAEAFRVLKPGGYLLAFGGSRTSHRLACAIEDVGFEIRDSIVWMYGQGFPKSLDVSKAIDKAAGAEREVVGTRTSAFGDAITSETGDGRNLWSKPSTTVVRLTGAPATDDARKWEGWGTALKPGMEPIVVARKPLSERTVAANVLQHGTGALNIDGCRIEGGEGGERDGEASATRRYTDEGGTNFAATPGPRGGDARGRWPANVVLSHVPDDFDADGNEVLGCQDGACAPGCPVAALDAQSGPAGENGGASRFFYQSKATNSERWGFCHDCGVVFSRGDKDAREVHKPHKVEYHPTVKPVDLMRWLVRLVTPPGGLVLDPFCGTGTTGEAASAEGFQFTGVEREPIYTAVATHRLITGGRIMRGAT